MDRYGYNISYYYSRIRQIIQPYINNYVKYEPSIDRVDDRLYVSDFATSCDIDTLKQIGITHIICCVIGIYPQFPDDFKYLLVDVGDIHTCNISEHFRNCNKYIDEALSVPENKVLIHCMYGISRSVTITCAYLMKKYSISSDKALEIIRDSRSIANPNKGFMVQLKEYEKQHKWR